MTQTQTTSANIVQLLSEGKVAFSYKNAAGETRNAVGTTNESLMPSDTTKIVQTNPATVTYFDTNVSGIRSFKLENLDESSVSPQS